MSIGVFGASGFIGRAIVRHLVAQGRRVVALSRSFPTGYAAEVGGPVETRLIDFTDPLSTHANLQGITRVIDLVNSSSPALGNSRIVDDLVDNVIPHVHFIQSCLLCDIERYVFVSSGGTVYGEPRYLPIDEEHPTNPLVSYGLAKLSVEQYLQMLSRNSAMSSLVLRVSNPFGPGQTLRKGQGLIASIVEKTDHGLPVTVFGTGQAKRDYLYIDDLCRAIETALDALVTHDTLNIATGVGRSVLDIVAAVEEALGRRIDIEFIPGRPTDIDSNVLDPRRAHDVIGWRATTSFHDGISRTIAAFRDLRAGERR